MDSIKFKNKKLIIFGFVIILLIGYLFTFKNKLKVKNIKDNKLKVKNIKDIEQKVKNIKYDKLKVDKIFNNNSFITVPNNFYGDYNLTYGEITWEGMENISKYMELKDWSKNTFIDLGSGNGKTLVYALLNGFKEAKGTEIVKTRHKYAMNMRKKLDSYMRDKIKLSNKDMFKLDPSYFPPGSVIFISNLVFSKDITQKLINFLGENTPSDVIIILSSIPDDLGKFKLIEKIELPMSWSVDSKCAILRKKNKNDD
jgi:hypothetical protein